MEQNGVKSARLLEIYSRLSEGAVLKKSELAAKCTGRNGGQNRRIQLYVL